MARFNYAAVDVKGREIAGVLDGNDTSNALRRIRDMGYFPTNVTRVVNTPKASRAVPAPTRAVKPAERPARKSVGGIRLRFLPNNKVRSKSLASFTRQLATLIDAGLPLLQGIEALRQQEKNPVLQRTMARVTEAVEGGSTFSDALTEHPQIFSKLYVNMVRAGEAGGMLEVTLKRLAEFQEKAQRIKGKVIAAMAYPTVVMTMAMMIVVLLMVKVVPAFQDVFRDLMNGRSLPGLTVFVVGVCDVVRHQCVLMACSAVGLFIAFRIVGKTVKGRFAIDSLKLRAPVFGQIVRKVGIARFARTLGTLISSGVPILQALSIVRETAGNAVIADAVSCVHDSVKEGEPIVRSLKASNVFPPMVISMVGVGEQTGSLPDMLIKVADIYDEEVDNAVGALTSLLEPIMIVFLAVIVATIVFAMFLPLIDVIVNGMQ
ncbi:MAG TPA: type II secretion system F family protein [Verrucomicrobiae bacterium]|nr:type II secretion system F family protein [Verrucomicrobiae bacterium]